VRKQFSPDVEKCRELTGDYRSPPGARCGAFKIRCPLSSTWFWVMINDDSEWVELKLPLPAWEHVSVSHVSRCPTWEEMCWFKDQFFLPEEAVVQFHPPKSVYVNNCDTCLHLYRIVGQDFPMPPRATV
jgi:hypothetical protein